MKAETGRSVSITAYCVYILSAYGLLRALAEMTRLCGAGREEYMLAAAGVAAAGLLLLYLPLCALGLKTSAAKGRLCAPGKMAAVDWILLAVLLVALVVLRFSGRTGTADGMYGDRFYRNLLFQGIGVLFVYLGMRRLGNSLMALFGVGAVLFLPSFANSLLGREYQSLLLAAFGLFLALFSLMDRWIGSRRGIPAQIGYWAVCIVCGWLMTDTKWHDPAHSTTLTEYGVLTAFYLFALLSVVGHRRSEKARNFLYGLPFAVCFVLYAVMGTPVQEQGFLHLFLGAAAGESVSHILKVNHMSDEGMRKDHMKSEERTAENKPAAEGERRKPAPGEYLDNPLPVPKRHVKKEMNYGFEPDPDKLFYDIPVSDEDDFDLK